MTFSINGYATHFEFYGRFNYRLKSLLDVFKVNLETPMISSGFVTAFEKKRKMESIGPLAAPLAPPMTQINTKMYVMNIVVVCYCRTSSETRTLTISTKCTPLTSNQRPRPLHRPGRKPRLGQRHRQVTPHNPRPGTRFRHRRARRS